MHTVVWLYFKIQWNLDKTKTQGTGKLCLLQWGFVIWRFFFTYCTIPGEKKIVRYTKDFVINYRGSSHWGFTVWWRKIQSMIKGQGWLWCSNAEHSCLVFVLKNNDQFLLKIMLIFTMKPYWTANFYEVAICPYPEGGRLLYIHTIHSCHVQEVCQLVYKLV